MTELSDTSSRLGLDFTAEVDVAGDVHVDADHVEALITIRARPTVRAAGQVRIAEVLIMDRSLSMADHNKMSEAKRAACAAIDALRDGAYLGIVAGNHEAQTIYPDPAYESLAMVDAEVKEAAKRRVNALWPKGGTAIGRWLTRAGELLESAPPGAVRHAALYTDGKNEHETPEELDRALAACADRFVCDARGLGDDWRYAELLRITEALHGTPEAVVAISDLTQDFTRLMGQAQSLVVPRVYLVLRLSHRFQLGLVRQTLPVEADLTGQQQRDGRQVRIPLGSWGPEPRQYRVSLRFAAATLPIGEEVRAARVELHAELPDGRREPCADAEAIAVRRHATTDPPPIPEGLTHAENVHELGMAMRACADAFLDDRLTVADHELRRAMKLARILQDHERLRLLESVATAEENGVARVRRDIGRGQIQRIGLESTRTITRPPELADVSDGPAAPLQDFADRICGTCGQSTYARGAGYCENCGGPLGEDPAGAR